MPFFDLSGQTALITGSSQGIGMALAKGLSKAGAKVILNGRDTAKLDTAKSQIEGDCDVLPFDVTDHQAVRTAVDGYEANNGPISILVNNAGMQHRTALEDFPADAFERLLQTNIASVFHVGQACARHMIKRGAGKIINIASLGSKNAHLLAAGAKWKNCKALVSSWHLARQASSTARQFMWMAASPPLSNGQ